MEELGFTSGRVFSDRGRLYTVSMHPGKRVYGERLTTVSGTEYREWDPRRSKLSAYITNGGRRFPFTSESRVLYLGASSGTTPSHVAGHMPRWKGGTVWNSHRGCSGNWWGHAPTGRT